MRRTLSSLVAILAFAAIAGTSNPARADSDLLCDPIPVTGGDVCECKFFNYGRSSTTISFKIFSDLGQVNECLDVVVDPEQGVKCDYTFTAGDDDCACKIEVSHSHSKSKGRESNVRARASINVLNPFDGPLAFDGRECR